MSDRAIAEYVGVDHVTVAKYRAVLVSSGEVHQIDTRTVKRGDQEYAINTANIGMAPESAINDDADYAPSDYSEFNNIEDDHDNSSLEAEFAVGNAK